jgi:nitroimidazol reductase NimA-like FMN-containing flavoprotein (pyridoxamine 5'-phosphate oxidase superfamily)
MPSTWSRSEKLDAGECLKLLSTVRWGRVAWASAEGPQVLPVNHTVLDGKVLLRTDLYSTIADATREGTVAFEADELDERMVSGWSVLVVGQADQLENPKEIRETFVRMGEPWAPGTRPLIVRIVPSRVTGRRFHRI